jgi:hypothetical protein
MSINNINTPIDFFKFAPMELNYSIFSYLTKKDVKRLALVCKDFFSKAVSFFNAQAKQESHLLLNQLKPLISKEIFENIEKARQPLENPTATRILQAEDNLLEFNSKTAKEFVLLNFNEYKKIETILDSTSFRLKPIYFLTQIYRDLKIADSKPSAHSYCYKIQRLMDLRDFKTAHETLKKIKDIALKQEAAVQIQGALYAKGKLSLLLELDNGNLIDEFSTIYAIDRSAFIFNLFVNFLTLNDESNFRECMNLMDDDNKNRCQSYLDCLNVLDIHLNYLELYPSYSKDLDDFIHSTGSQGDPILLFLLKAKKEKLKHSFIAPVCGPQERPKKKMKLEF